MGSLYGVCVKVETGTRMEMLSDHTNGRLVSCSIEKLFAYHEGAARETIWLSSLVNSELS